LKVLVVCPLDESVATPVAPQNENPRTATEYNTKHNSNQQNQQESISMITLSAIQLVH